MEMSQDAWVKQQTQQSGDRQNRKTSPVSGSGDTTESASQHAATTFAPIIPQYNMPMHGGSMGRYPPPLHLPLHGSRRPAAPKPSPSQSPHARNYR